VRPPSRLARPGRLLTDILGHDEGDRVVEAYGPNYARLSQAKARFDPLNVFRVNQNITPSPAGAVRATLAWRLALHERAQRGFQRSGRR